ncbi:major facilitator superfamily domain-containing protein [Aspergillus stella-maris]|uniref:major facilitator superfamily domain-containing protein n=1 Tax=Aspergillus stella-maris TaxID=1810926 RepID=UPI003CCCC641
MYHSALEVPRHLTFESALPQPVHPNPSIPPDISKLNSPYNWSPFYKNLITYVSCIATLFASFAASCSSLGAEQMASEWGIGQVATLVGITMFCCGFAVGPMFLAPFSEVVGRKPVFVATAFLSLVCQVCCAVTRLYPGMLVARFFAGVGRSTFSTMVGGIIADIYTPTGRNTPMTLFSAGALFGTGLGPLVCGFIGQYTTWRWIFYIQIIIAGIITISVVLFFRETRSAVVLRQRAKASNAWYETLQDAGCKGLYFPQPEPFSGEDETEKEKEEQPLRIRFKVAADEDRASLVAPLRTSLSRPFLLLLTEPVIFFFSLWAAFSWSVLYIFLSVIPLVFQSTYGFSLSDSNAIFTATCVGSLLATALPILQDRLASRRENWNTTPEHRLYFSCIESYSVHWIVPAIAVGISTMGIFAVYLAVFNYLVDTYHLFNNLGFGAAASLLGGVGAGLTLVPWVLIFFGERIRRKSKLAREIMG